MDRPSCIELSSVRVGHDNRAIGGKSLKEKRRKKGKGKEIESQKS